MEFKPVEGAYISKMNSNLIGNDIKKSHTFSPNISKIDEELTIIDYPGFNDSRGKLI